MVAYALDKRGFRRACNYRHLYENLVYICLDMTKGAKHDMVRGWPNGWSCDRSIYE